MSPFAAIAFAAVLVQPAAPAVPAAAARPSSVEHKIYGFVQSLGGGTLVIRDRSGRAVVVDGRSARTSVTFYRGRPVIVYGTTDAAGVVHATAIWRTYPDAAHWPADR